MTDHDHDRDDQPQAPAQPEDSSRRRFLAGGAAGLAALATAGASASTERPEAFPWQGDKGPRFAGKSVLITGATSGIGEATARAFAAQGAKVCFCGRRAELGEKVASEIRDAGGEARYVQADVREHDQVRDFVKACAEVHGGIDIAFNNAGIEGPLGDMAAYELEGEMSYRDVMRTNLDGVYYAIRHELPVMREQGHGVIINTASRLGSTGTPQGGAYSATKHAVIGLTRSAALTTAGENIRVLSVSPGPVDTALLRRSFGDQLDALAESNPAGRIAQPPEVAAAVLNLAAPESAYINGADIAIDGGASA